MKNSSLIPTLLAATLFLFPVLRADDSADAAAAEAPAAKQKRHAEILKRFDANADGKLDENEKAAAKLEMGKAGGAAGNGALRKRAMDRFDKDGDGQLNAEERATAGETIANDPRVIKRFDANGDGKLDEAERAKAREALQKRMANRQGGGAAGKGKAKKGASESSTMPAPDSATP